MAVKVLNYNVNDANFPSELPPPNDWMIETNLSQAETGKIILSSRFYTTITRDGNIAALG